MTTTREIATHFNDCYKQAKEKLGDNFDQVMADLAAEVITCQSKCKEGTSLFAAALILTIPMTEEELLTDGVDREEEAEMHLFTKASAVWWLLEEKKARDSV